MDEAEMDDMLMRLMHNAHSFSLKKKTHIKEYYKIRNLHREIVASMADYYDAGHFELGINPSYVSPEHADPKSGQDSEKLVLFNTGFDMETREGAQAFFDLLIYKQAPNMNCITEEYLARNRFRKPEKLALLQSMLHSTLGLFEITQVDEREGFVFLRDIFTASEHKIIDVGLSGSKGQEKVYLYTRIITAGDISFNTGLSLVFDKTDSFIQDFIRRHKSDYQVQGECGRFMELYNQFSKDPHKYQVVPNTF